MASKCTTLAIAVETKFDDVRLLIQELLEACTEAESDTQNQNKETTQQMQAIKVPTM